MAAAELSALGTRSGRDPRLPFDVVPKSSGQSRTIEDRGPHMLDGDYAPRSMVGIFVKDSGSGPGGGRKESRVPLPSSAVAHQMFLAASARSHGGLDDSAVVKACEALAARRLLNANTKRGCKVNDMVLTATAVHA